MTPAREGETSSCSRRGLSPSGGQGLRWAGEPPRFRQPFPQRCKAGCRAAGRGGIAISPSSKAAHLFPGIGCPAPRRPRAPSGRKLTCSGAVGKGNCLAGSHQRGTGCHGCNNSLQLPGPVNQLLPTVLGLSGRGDRLQVVLPNSHKTHLLSPIWTRCHPWLPASPLAQHEGDCEGVTSQGEVCRK